ncbi:MAG TPA: tRNA (N6-threonylcarbamoyladenosine(37)-N6)-methyltransferase TrmO [Polyangiaceae bacterium]|nr:tRNA (N6-threonylcarbamoyladenosine(37)-N6)-methyltransferase TrmO [Polyangiaceae bacterium]
MTPDPRHASLTLRPIGVVHSPFQERRQAPRQPAAARDVHGTIELFAGNGYEHALLDLEQWSHLWVLFWFHLNQGWRPKVLPPRGRKRRGLFATRAPHRPNPIGLSVVKLERVSGLVLEVSGLDMLDGTPVLDLKPYVAYCDALPDAESGWLEQAEDPIAPYRVEFSTRADQQLEFLAQHFAISLRQPIEQVLELGPEQHAYRRIKRAGDQLILAVKDWRARFEVLPERRIVVLEVFTGYRPRELAESNDAALDPHREFSLAFRPEVPS